MSKKILVLMTGGTIAQEVDSTGRMKIAKSIDDLIDSISTDATIDRHSFGARTGANLTFKTAIEVRNHILTRAGEYDGFVLITGTDSMEEFAYFLDSTLRIDPPIVLTGAMKPSDIVGYDGIANLEQAVQVAADPAARERGVLLVMNDSIHLARYVRKQDTQLIGAFTSHPGPVGQIRNGRNWFYFRNDRNESHFDIDGMDDIEAVVPSFIFTFGARLPQEMLPYCDGLVIAGMGTSSISEAWIDELSKDWTSKIPVVLVSRCWEGTNYDNTYYRGSLDKYEEKGFLLKQYEHLNIMQARIKLLLEIATRNRT